MPTNLTDRLGELVEHADDRVEGRYQLGRFVLLHKDEILSALRKAEAPASGDYAELVGRLRAPDLWAAVSSSGVHGIDGAPVEAATAIERLTAREAELCEALRPFARDFADAGKCDHLPDDMLWNVANGDVADKPTCPTTITVGDLRRARLSLGDEK